MLLVVVLEDLVQSPDVKEVATREAKEHAHEHDGHDYQRREVSHELLERRHHDGGDGQRHEANHQVDDHAQHNHRPDGRELREKRPADAASILYEIAQNPHDAEKRKEEGHHRCRPF